MTIVIPITSCKNCYSLLNVNKDDLIKSIVKCIHDKCELDHIIYRRVILNNFKQFSFYRIFTDINVWCGKLEDYLRIDEIIVEVIIMGGDYERIFVVMNICDTISTIKSVLKDIVYISRNVQVFKSDGTILSDDNTLECICQDYRIIFSYGDSFQDCCVIYNIMLMNHHYHLFTNLSWNKNTPREDYEKLQECIANIQTDIHVDESNSVRMCKLCSSLPVVMQDLIWVLFDNLVHKLLLSNCYNVVSFALKPFPAIQNSIKCTVFLAVLYYYARRIDNSKENNIKACATGVRYDNIEEETTVGDVWDHVLEYLINPVFNRRELMTLVLKVFKLGTRDNTETIKECFDWNIGYFLVYKKSIFKRPFIPMPKNVLEIKRSMALECNMETDHIKFFTLGGDHILQDEELIDFWDTTCMIKSSVDYVENGVHLGSGAFGDVVLCENVQSRRQFALKKMKNASNNLDREITILSRLSDSFYNIPYVARLFNIYSSGDLVNIGIELVEKGSLRSYLTKNRSLSVDHIRKVSSCILQALKYIHARQIIHRDIKTDNILLDKDFNAKLCDFGLAKYVFDLSEDDFQRNRANYVKGTISYMAPELLNKEQYSEKIDIWSYGITTIYMISAEHPYHYLAPHQIMFKIATQRKIQYVFPDGISKELISFTQACLESDPILRPSASALLKSDFISKR